jgi:hypothetical protein
MEPNEPWRPDLPLLGRDVLERAGNATRRDLSADPDLAVVDVVSAFGARGPEVLGGIPKHPWSDHRSQTGALFPLWQRPSIWVKGLGGGNWAGGGGGDGADRRAGSRQTRSALTTPCGGRVVAGGTALAG